MKLTLLALALLLPVTQRPPAPVKPAPEDPQKSTLSLSFGVYQSDKATVMYKKLTPVLEYLQEDLEHRIGRPVDLQLSIFKSYDDGIAALVKGQIDFVRFGPASYITAKQREPRLDLIAMEQENGEKRFRGVVIVRNDSPIQKLADLKGKRFAFGDENSTIGRYLIQAELVKAGIHASDLAGSKFLERHDKVAAAVQIGDFDAGAVATGTYEQANAKGTLRVIASFDNVTKPWVARAGFDPDVMAALRQGLMGIKDPAVLKELKVSGFVATSDEEYGFVREGMKVADEFEKRPGS